MSSDVARTIADESIGFCGLIKPLLATWWRHAFQAAVDGLIETAQGAS